MKSPDCIGNVHGNEFALSFRVDSARRLGRRATQAAVFDYPSVVRSECRLMDGANKEVQDT